jgi:hypothetical protein
MPNDADLTILGTGIVFGAHTSVEAIRAIEEADHVLHLLSDPEARASIARLNASVEDLADELLKPGSRRVAHDRMVDRVLRAVRSGRRTVLAVYGHPTVLAYPTRAAATRAAAEGYQIVTMPGISAEAALYADLNLDPGECGMLSIEATDFLVFGIVPPPSAGLLLWQVGLVGNISTGLGHPSSAGRGLLADRLAELYGASHRVVIYQASRARSGRAAVEIAPVRALMDTEVSVLSTIFVPPARVQPADPSVLERLGLAAARPRSLWHWPRGDGNA